MPRFPTAQKRPDTVPSFLVTARSFYGEAFGPRRPEHLAESMADWSELTEEERSFALAHLQYLNLVAQAGTQRMLARVVELLEELVDATEDLAYGDRAESAEDADRENDPPEDEPEEWQQSFEQFVQPSVPDEDEDVIDAGTVPVEELDDQEDSEEFEEVPDGEE